MSALTSSPIEVVVVDDQRAILAGVSALIDSAAPRMRVTGRARNGREALAIARDAQPDVIVLDVELGEEDGLDLIPRLQACCDAAIVVFTSNADAAIARRARRLGAAGLVPKTAAGDALLSAIRAAG